MSCAVRRLVDRVTGWWLRGGNHGPEDGGAGEGGGGRQAHPHSVQPAGLMRGRRRLEGAGGEVRMLQNVRFHKMPVM